MTKSKKKRKRGSESLSVSKIAAIKKLQGKCLPATFIIRLPDSSIATSLFSCLLLSLYYIIIISYIFKFVNMGNHMRALIAYFCERSELDAARVPWVPPSAARPNKQAFVAHMGEHREPVSGARGCIWGPTFNRKKCHMGLRGGSRALPDGQRPAIISYFYKIVKYFL